MPKIARIITLASMFAQTGLLFAQARHVSGVVIDPEGKPVAEAWIDHTGFHPRFRAFRTDSEGRFTLDTKAPVVVIRKAGFRSELLRTPDAFEVRITLRKAVGIRALQVCSYCKTCEGLEGWGAWFFFPMSPEVTAGPQSFGSPHDGVRGYYVDTKQGRKSIGHGARPLWSDGTPLDEDVWRSVEYQETAFEFRGVTIIDARGRLPNGKWWRYLGRPGESADYSDVDEAAARILDRVLDGVCLTSGPYGRY